MPQVTHAIIAPGLRARVTDWHAEAATATDHQPAQQSGPLARSAASLPAGTVLPQLFLIPLKALPGDVRRHAIVQQRFPLLKRHRLAGLARTAFVLTFRVDLKA